MMWGANTDAACDFLFSKGYFLQPLRQAQIVIKNNDVLLACLFVNFLLTKTLKLL